MDNSTVIASDFKSAFLASLRLARFGKELSSACDNHLAKRCDRLQQVEEVLFKTPRSISIFIKSVKKEDCSSLIFNLANALQCLVVQPKKLEINTLRKETKKMSQLQHHQ